MGGLRGTPQGQLTREPLCGQAPVSNGTERPMTIVRDAGDVVLHGGLGPAPPLLCPQPLIIQVHREHSECDARRHEGDEIGLELLTGIHWPAAGLGALPNARVR